MRFQARSRILAHMSEHTRRPSIVIVQGDPSPNLATVATTAHETAAADRPSSVRSLKRSPAAADGSAPAAGETGARSGSSPARVLAVDDEPANLLVLHAQLDPSRYALTSLEDPTRAVHVLMHEGPFDAVLLDMRMPGMSGLEVARAIRRIYPVTWCPILFVSASRDSADVVAAFRAGGNDFIPKPFDYEELLRRLDLHLEISAAFREAVRPPRLP
jgi:CheY-like chemotaxis protein